MWVGLSKFIIQKMEPTRMFSYIYDNPKCFTFTMEQVPYSLRVSERRSINNLTRRFAETLVMYIYPQVERAISKNRKDCVTSFMEPIYSTCLDRNASVTAAMEIGDSCNRFIKLTSQQLRENHDYTRPFNGDRIVNIITQLSVRLEFNRRKLIKWDDDWAYKLLDDVISEIPD